MGLFPTKVEYLEECEWYIVSIEWHSLYPLRMRLARPCDWWDLNSCGPSLGEGTPWGNCRRGLERDLNLLNAGDWSEIRTGGKLRTVMYGVMGRHEVIREFYYAL